MSIHEEMHTVGTASHWSESYYFNFYDPIAEVGIFTRMGWRPGSGWADALHVVYLPGSRVAFTYGRREIDEDLTRYTGDLNVGNLSIACVEPHKEWTLAYSGEAQDISDGAVLLQRSKLRPEGWFTPAHMEMGLTMDCQSDPHFVLGEEHGHFEQCGRFTGTVKVGADEWEVDGYGVRDKSWGPRDWSMGGSVSDKSGGIDSSPSPHVNWFSMNFGPDLAMGGSVIRQADGSWTTMGSWLFRDGTTTELANVDVESEYREGSILHQNVRMTIITANGETIHITGEVINMCPTKVPAPGGAIFINEGLAKFQWEDKTAYGISEQWHIVGL